MQVLERAFRFHPLAIEDCLHVDQRPKLEEYGTHVFIAMHALRCVQGDDPSELETLELHTFLGNGYLVTIHLQPNEKLDLAWKRASGDPGVMKRGADFLFYLVADGIVDSHFLHLDRISEHLEDVENDVLERPQAKSLQRIFSLKHALVTMRKTLSPQRDVFAILARRTGDHYVSERSSLYFRDIYDHLVRIYESIDAARDLLGAALEAYLSMVAQRTNEVMKSLTILSAVFLPLTFVTGFFGQNFAPLQTPFFMWTMLALCALIPIGMLAYFAQKRWL